MKLTHYYPSYQYGIFEDLVRMNDRYFLNFLFILNFIVYLILFLYKKVNQEVDYYQNYEALLDDSEPNSPLTIAMFTNNYYPFLGGVPISIKRLKDGLEKQGHQVVLFAPKYPDTQTDDEPGIYRCPLLFFYRSKGFDFAIANIFSKQIENQFLMHDFDVVHVHHPFWMGKKGLKLAKKYKIPVIYTYHTRLEKYAHYLLFFKKSFQNIISHHIIKRFSQKCDAIIAPTTSAREYLENIGVSREKFILPTGICFDHYVNCQSLIDKKALKVDVVLCSVSRLSKEKNIDFLIDGIDYIHQHTNKRFKLFLIGNGPEYERLMSKIDVKNLNHVIELVGSLPPEKVCEYYICSDLFVFSSLSETQGMVILEAMAGGCPVVAIRSSGIDDIIENEINGFKTRANIIDWAERVIQVIENPSLQQNLSQNALQAAYEYSMDEMASKVEDIYRKKIRLMQCQAVSKQVNQWEEQYEKV
jgi:1,2-diacylglycerol 3-alpha-glucosyltransferase